MSCVGDSLAFLREQNGRISALGKIPKCPSLKNPPSPRPHPRPPDRRAHCDSVPVPPCGLRPRARRRPGSRRPHRRVHLEQPKCRSPWPLHSSIRIPQITWRFINPSASLQSSWHPNPVKCHPIWQAEELSVQQGSLLQPCSLAGSPPKPYIWTQQLLWPKNPAKSSKKPENFSAQAWMTHHTFVQVVSLSQFCGYAEHYLHKHHEVIPSKLRLPFLGYLAMWRSPVKCTSDKNI